MGRRDRDDDDDEEEEEEEEIEPTKPAAEEGVEEEEEEEEVPDDDPGVVANVTRLVFENMPKVTLSVKLICPNCQHENEIKLEGLQSFFS